MIDGPDPRSGLRPGVPVRRVRLSDGGFWGLALPCVRIKPRVERYSDGSGGSIERIEIDAYEGYPMGIDRLVNVFSEACSSGSVSAQYESFVELSVELLQRAHDIDRETARELLDVTGDDLADLVDAVIGIIREAVPALKSAPTEVIFDESARTE